MGILRKAISGSLALGTGGLSLGVVQYRSDTERAARQTKLLRQEMQREHADTMAMYALQQAAADAEATIAALQYSGPSAAQAASFEVAAPQASPGTAVERVANLARLAALRDSGVLTDDEYERERAAILNA